MNEFIENNSLWLIPVVSVFLSVLFKVGVLSTQTKLKTIDFFDFGIELMVSSMILLFTNLKDKTGGWIGILFLAFTIALVVFMSRAGWQEKVIKKKTDKDEGVTVFEKKISGVIIPDIIGLVSIFVVSVYLSGGII